MAQTAADVVGQREVAALSPGMTVREACRVLDRINVGAAVVLDGQRLIGIFSERDVIRKCICQSRRTDDTLVRDIMTPDPTVIDAGDNLTRALHMMTQGRFRHLPVMRGATCIGILSLREIPMANHIMYDRFYAAAASSPARTPGPAGA